MGRLFSTFKIGLRRFIALNIVGNAIRVIDDDGKHYGAWRDVVDFRKAWKEKRVGEGHYIKIKFE